MLFACQIAKRSDDEEHECAPQYQVDPPHECGFGWLESKYRAECFPGMFSSDDHCTNDPDDEEDD